MSLFNIFKTNKDSQTYLKSFSNTKSKFGSKLLSLVSKDDSLDSFLQDLMVTLLEADIGYKTSDLICKSFKEKCNNFNSLSACNRIEVLIETLKNLYGISSSSNIVFNENGPTVILLVGVNGSGKTSTCAKLANKFLDLNKTVCLVAGDTFRAGASEQLNKWANELNIHCVIGNANADPSSVFVDGCKYALENKIDVLICDSAGRLQNKVNLMSELEKMKRVLNKNIVNAPHYTYLVIDSNTGQNGISQAELFNEVSKIDGTILTKVDGTSKGGIVFAIKNLTNIPVSFLTFGESINDIKDFDLDLYLYSIIGDLENEK